MSATCPTDDKAEVNRSSALHGVFQPLLRMYAAREAMPGGGNRLAPIAKIG